MSHDPTCARSNALQKKIVQKHHEDNLGLKNTLVVRVDLKGEKDTSRTIPSTCWKGHHHTANGSLHALKAGENEVHHHYLQPQDFQPLRGAVVEADYR